MSGTSCRYCDLTRFDPDTVGAAKLHDSYDQARGALREAAGQAVGAAAATVIDRLTRNAEVALADLRIGLLPPAGWCCGWSTPCRRPS